MLKVLIHIHWDYPTDDVTFAIRYTDGKQTITRILDGVVRDYVITVDLGTKIHFEILATKNGVDSSAVAIDVDTSTQY